MIQGVGRTRRNPFYASRNIAVPLFGSAYTFSWMRGGELTYTDCSRIWVVSIPYSSVVAADVRISPNSSTYTTPSAGSGGECERD